VTRKRRGTKKAKGSVPPPPLPPPHQKKRKGRGNASQNGRHRPHPMKIEEFRKYSCIFA
jgi:hypothetical protein